MPKALLYVSLCPTFWPFTYIFVTVKSQNWSKGGKWLRRGTKCLVFLKRGDDSNFPFSWLFKLRLFSAELRLPCFWWWSPPFNSSRFSRIRLPPPSLYVCTMISTWSKKTRASIHGKSCCNLLQRLMGVDCARGLWLVAALNESHDSRVRKEQHIKSLFFTTMQMALWSQFSWGFLPRFLAKFE